MSKELDEFYKKYSARIIEMDDTPLVKVMDGGKFKLLSIEEYEEMTNKLADLEAKLAEKEKIEFTDTINFVETSEPDIVANELDRLNQQLAEKDKEIREVFAKYQYYKRKCDLHSYDKSLKIIKRKCLKALTHQQEDKGE